jgi:hypothetical protein
MNLQKIGIGVGILFIFVIIVLMLRKKPAPSPSNKCEQECTDYEDCVNGVCVSKCGDKQLSNNVNWWCTLNDLNCDINTNTWSCDVPFCQSSQKEKYPNAQCDDKGFYVTDVCNNHGKKYVAYKDQRIPADEKCSCDDGYHGNTCEIVCNPDTELFNGRECVCNTQKGYNGTAGNCLKCDFPTIYSDNKCICDQSKGYFGTPGNCIQCNATQVFSGGKCICKQGYFEKNGICVQENCGGNGTYDGTKCQCQSGYYRPNDESCEQCPENSVTNATGDGCICKDGFIAIDGKCQACQGTIIDGTCIKNPQITTAYINGCDGINLLENKYRNVTYFYGPLADKSIDYYRDVSIQPFYTDIDLTTGMLQKCDQGSFGKNCEKTSATECSNCQGIFNGNSCICNTIVSNDKIDGCRNGAIPDTYLTTYYDGSRCETSKQCYVPKNTDYNTAFANGVCKCNQGVCGDKCQTSVCKECNGRTSSITCNQDGTATCGTCDQGYEGDTCACDKGTMFNKNNGPILLDVCGTNEVDIYKCSDTKRSKCDTPVNTYGYCKTKPENCTEYNNYLQKLIQSGIIDQTNPLLCGKICSGNTPNGPYCNDKSGSVSFDCYGNCDTSGFKGCTGENEIPVCDVTTGYQVKCVADTNYIDYSTKGACDINKVYENSELFKQAMNICPGGFSLAECTIGNQTGCVFDCKLPGVYTVPKQCVQNVAGLIENSYKIYDDNINQNIYVERAMEGNPVAPTYQMFLDKTNNWQSETYPGIKNPGGYGVAGSDWSWMFNNPRGHVVNVSGFSDWENSQLKK